MSVVHKYRAPDHRGKYILNGGPQYWTCIVLPFWCLDFWGGSQVFWKFVHPCLWLFAMKFAVTFLPVQNRARADQDTKILSNAT